MHYVYVAGGRGAASGVWIPPANETITKDMLLRRDGLHESY
jgi:hypothetical protein